LLKIFEKKKVSIQIKIVFLLKIVRTVIKQTKCL